MKQWTLAALIGIALVLSGCAHSRQSAAAAPKSSACKGIPCASAVAPAPSVYTVKLPPIRGIESNGVMTINVNGGSRHQKVTFSGNPEALKRLQFRVADGVLYLRPVNNVKFRNFNDLVVNLNIYHLNYLSVKNGIVQGHNIKGKQLKMITSGRAVVHLSGDVNATHIITKNRSEVTLGWVQSETLNVIAFNSSIIHLSGVVHDLTARVYNNARLDANYLRANSAWMLTTNSAAASISPIDSLHAFARNKSNIYYFKTPKHIQITTRQSGDVLQMGYST